MIGGGPSVQNGINRRLIAYSSHMPLIMICTEPFQSIHFLNYIKHILQCFSPRLRYSLTTSSEQSCYCIMFCEAFFYTIMYDLYKVGQTLL